MPYPFAQAPTFAEFREALEQDYNCEYKHAEGEIRNQTGDTFPVTYFQREVDGEILTAVIVADSDDERIPPSVIRSVCKRLKIDPTPFGLNLG